MGNKKKRYEQHAESSTKPTRSVLSTVLTVFSYLITLIIGSGVGWQYVQWDIQRENQANDIQKQVIGA
jgi:hypothetical protein